jgi:hypothetical protein
MSSAEWSYDAGRGVLTLALKGGEHSVEVFETDPSSLRLAPNELVRTGLADHVEFRIADKTAVAEWGSARTANNTQALWGQFESAPGIYRARLEGGGDVWLNGDRLVAGQEALVARRNQFLVESKLGATPPRITLEPLYSSEQAVPAIAFSDSDARLAPNQLVGTGPASAIKIEAETYAEGIRGTPQIYSHRTFLSGGKGVSTPPTMGVGARWKVIVPGSGRYAVVLKVATHEPSAVRALTIDAKGAAGGQPLVRFPNTGGFGGTPAEWKHFAVGDWLRPAVGPVPVPLQRGQADFAGQNQPVPWAACVELSAGPHVIELVSVEGLLNLDYILLLAE